MANITMEHIQKRNKINIAIGIVCLFLFTQSCVMNREEKKERVFSEVLEKHIINFMSLYEKNGDRSTETFSVWGDSIGDVKYIFLGTGLSYNKDRISSYTFLEDRLITFSKPYDEFPFKGWINSDLLTKFKDSIPNYQEYSSIQNPPDFDPISRQLEIVSQDSLRIIDTKMSLYRSFVDEKIKYLQETGRDKELEDFYRKRSLYTSPAVQPIIEE